ncbi:MAG: tRNA uridine-5-carboxymethylaminomethyl(34) synthesis GTPase MnmE [Magnetococcales bacterium]|nr:tRNA uridine-5-carboxymethylaminomethyl(34) synthesis GTPase MnmE [Magnetococcales bacterium]
MSYSRQPVDTDGICGLATPVGSGAVGVIRVSGPGCLRGMLPLLRRPGGGACGVGDFEPRKLVRADICDGLSGGILDQLLVVCFPAPHSFTGEEVVELHGHGSPVVLERILRQLVAAAGLRLARPGEFSKRAFLNGKMDLIQAEAVMRLIGAGSLRAAREATRQLGGGLSRRLGGIRARLVEVLAEVEACLDFADEEIETADGDELCRRLDPVIAELESLLAGSAFGRRLREGFELVLVGRPNVGKSSLFNRLLGRDKAIVTPLAGTTRDLNEGCFEVAGVVVTVVDTAGFWESADPVEREGMRRARGRMAGADGLWVVAEAQEGLVAGDWEILAEVESSRMAVVFNKADLVPGGSGRPLLPGDWRYGEVYAVSSLDGAGFAELESLLRRWLGVMDPGEGEGETILVARQQEALEDARDAVLRSRDLLREDKPWELVAIPLRDSLGVLGFMVGETGVEAILDRIFSTFCVGK